MPLCNLGKWIFTLHLKLIELCLFCQCYKQKNKHYMTPLLYQSYTNPQIFSSTLSQHGILESPPSNHLVLEVAHSLKMNTQHSHSNLNKQPKLFNDFQAKIIYGSPKYTLDLQTKIISRSPNQNYLQTSNTIFGFP